MNVISDNPLDYVSLEDLFELGLTLDDIKEAYQPSSGGVFHARGAESQGKTLYIAHYYRYLIDRGFFTPYDAVGNISFKGKYGAGFTTLKGDDLRQYLWELTHVPYENKIVIIDEADSEFPARFFPEREQTEIALRLWHTAKMHNYIFMSSHIGNSVDLIMHLATHYFVYPRKPNFVTNSMEFSMFNRLDIELTDWEATDIIKTMLIYNRRELTEKTGIEYAQRPIKQKKETRQASHSADDIDLEKELEGLNLL